MPEHTSLKCHLCARCVREGEAERRVGAGVISLWSSVGPFVIVLCGSCMRPALEALHLPIEAIEESAR